MKTIDEISKESLSDDINVLYNVFRPLVMAMDSIDLEEEHEFIGHETIIKEKYKIVFNKIQSLNAERKRIEERKGDMYSNSKYASK